MYKHILLTILFILLGSVLAFSVFRWQHLPPISFLSPLSSNGSAGTEIFVADTNFSIEEAPSDSLRGEIASTTGDVFWQSRVATDPAELVESVVLQQGELIQTDNDSSVVLRFEEIVGLRVFEKSEVELTQTLPLQMVFNQYRGDVEYVGTGESPISVRVGWLLVTLVNGNVRVTMDPDSELIFVDLSKGSATVAFNDIGFETQVIELKEGQVFEFDNEEREGVVES